MLAGSIANNKLSNSSITIGASSVSLGGSLTSITGPLAITTSASADKAFKIQRTGAGEQTAI